MINIDIREETAHFLWEQGICGANIGIVWDKESAELINAALKFYKDNYKEVPND